MPTMPRTFRVIGTPVSMELPAQGAAAGWRFGVDQGGVTVEQATEVDTTGDVSHVFTVLPGQGYTAWYERLLFSGTVIGSRTISPLFDVGDPVPPTQVYRISGVVTLEPVVPTPDA